MVLFISQINKNAKITVFPDQNLFIFYSEGGGANRKAITGQEDERVQKEQLLERLKKDQEMREQLRDSVFEKNEKILFLKEKAKKLEAKAGKPLPSLQTFTKSKFRKSSKKAKLHQNTLEMNSEHFKQSENV